LQFSSKIILRVLPNEDHFSLAEGLAEPQGAAAKAVLAVAKKIDL